MSSYFSGKKCSVCGVVFNENDDVVACPVCGAPHHRECWSGQCAFFEKHGTDEQWKAETEEVNEEPVIVEDGSNDEQNSQTQEGKAITCIRCGRVNFPAGEKCIYCGNSFEKQDDSIPFSSTVNKYPFMIDPLGGVDPYEDIGGVSAGETAEFVVANTVRYIPKFSKMSRTKKSASWNWAAFLIPEYWFFYRKCYIQGIFVMLMKLISDILSMPFTQWVADMMDSKGYQGTISYISSNLSAVYTPKYLLYLVSIGLLFGISVICGIFGDAIYKKHCINKINDIKGANNPLPVRIMKVKKGGISIFAPVIAYSLYELLVPIILDFIR